MIIDKISEILNENIIIRMPNMLGGFRYFQEFLEIYKYRDDVIRTVSEFLEKDAITYNLFLSFLENEGILYRFKLSRTSSVEFVTKDKKSLNENNESFYDIEFNESEYIDYVLEFILETTGPENNEKIVKNEQSFRIFSNLEAENHFQELYKNISESKCHFIRNCFFVLDKYFRDEYFK